MFHEKKFSRSKKLQHLNANANKKQITQKSSVFKLQQVEIM